MTVGPRQVSWLTLRLPWLGLDKSSTEPHTVMLPLDGMVVGDGKL